MSSAAIPESRVYRHAACGAETTVSGQAFEVVSNPMSSMERTWCSTCQAMFPIDEYAWADTGETIAAYYARHTERATAAQRFLCSKSFMVALVLLGGVLAAGGAYSLVRNNGVLTRIVCVAGGLVIGAMLGATVFLGGFANPIKRKVCGVSDTRLLR